MAVNPKSFRYDINALRAIAIMGVLLYHYKVNAFKGGFAGVDVFFVISGYLMSRVVIGLINNGQFSFSDYFNKRLHRIVPALLVLILLLTIACFFFYFPDDYVANERNAASSIIFLSNLYYWQNAPSYFAASADTNMFLHTWSLSVEWQFYLVYPFILLLLAKLFKGRVFKVVFIGLTLLTFVASVIVSHYNAEASFYLLPTRSWEMMAGGIAFLAEGKVIPLIWKKVLAVAGYILILLCFYFLNEALLWPGVYTLLPVFGTFLIIVANYNNFKVIRHGSIQFMGKISYSLYLWHWPVYVIAQYYGLGTGFTAVFAFCVIAVALGSLSFRYIESLKFTGKQVIGTGVVFLFALVFAISYFNANTIVFKDKTLAIQGYKTVYRKPFFTQYRKDTCFVEDMTSYKKGACLCFDDNKKNVLLIGDSHLAQLSQSLRQRFAKENVNFLQATATGTLPTVRSYYAKKNNIRELMDYTFHDFIPKNAAKIDGVILSGNWAGQRLIVMDSILYGIKEAISYLKRYNIPVIVIGQTERYTVAYPTIAARNSEYGSNNNAFYIDDYTTMLNGYLSAHLRASYINIINKHIYPPLSAKGAPYMRDKDHVTKYGADLIVKNVMQDPVAVKFFKQL